MSDLVSMAKQATVKEKTKVLKTFAFVPDDKLTWSPSPTSKSALQIAAHIGFSNHGIARVLRGEPFPADSIQEMRQMQAARVAEITSRAQAEALIEDATGELLTVLDSLTPEQLAGEVKLPFATIPVAGFIFFGAHHMNSHASQIDYLQTIWGDEEEHM